MEILILAVGERMPDWVEQGVNEYVKRMPRELRVHVKPIRAVARSDNKSVPRVLALEAQRIETQLPRQAEVIALDERGESWSTAKLAKQMQTWLQDGRDAAFLIGGADGLDAALKARARCNLSLSAMTLPHALARLLLAEQLYRAASMIKNHPYHRA